MIEEILVVAGKAACIAIMVLAVLAGIFIKSDDVHVDNDSNNFPPVPPVI